MNNSKSDGFNQKHFYYFFENPLLIFFSTDLKSLNFLITCYPSVVSRSVNISHFLHVLQNNAELMSTELGTEHLLVKEIIVGSNEGVHLFPNGIIKAK